MASSSKIGKTGMEFEENEQEVLTLLREQRKMLDEKKTKDTKSKGKSSGSAVGKDAQRANKSKRSGLVFPVGKIDRRLKEMGVSKRISQGASVYLGAVLEFLTAEVLELAGNTCKKQKKQRILPRHIQLAIADDEELQKYLGSTTIAQGGVNPNNIPPQLMGSSKRSN